MSLSFHNSPEVQWAVQVSLGECEVKKDNDTNKLYTTYTLIFRIGDDTHKLISRYSELLSIHESLEKQGLLAHAWRSNSLSKPVFPAKTWFKDMTKPKNYTKRAQEILKYFQKLTSKPRILSDSKFQKGIQLPKKLRKNIKDIAKDLVLFICFISIYIYSILFLHVYIIYIFLCIYTLDILYVYVCDLNKFIKKARKKLITIYNERDSSLSKEINRIPKTPKGKPKPNKMNFVKKNGNIKSYSQTNGNNTKNGNKSKVISKNKGNNKKIKKIANVSDNSNNISKNYKYYYNDGNIVKKNKYPNSYYEPKCNVNKKSIQQKNIENLGELLDNMEASLSKNMMDFDERPLEPNIQDNNEKYYKILKDHYIFDINDILPNNEIIDSDIYNMDYNDDINNTTNKPSTYNDKIICNKLNTYFDELKKPYNYNIRNIALDVRDALLETCEIFDIDPNDFDDP